MSTTAQQLTEYFEQHVGISAVNTYRTLSRFDAAAKQLAQAIIGEPVKTLGPVYRLLSCCFDRLTDAQKIADLAELEQ